MAESNEFKIRTLPRKDELRRPRARVRLSGRVVGGVAIALSLALGTYAALPAAAPPARELSSQQPPRDPMAKRLNRFVEDVKFKEEALRQRRELENLRVTDQAAMTSATVPVAERPLGVTMDSENTADRLYDQLNDRPTLNVDSLPESRINARLEKNKWVNALDRQERVQYVKNFIKTAYDRGYEVELDQNLVVIGVRPLQNRTVSLDQVIDRISKQGL